MTSTPSVVSARHVGGHRLEVAFADGTTKSIDFSRWLSGPVFEPLMDVDYFRRFKLDGWTVSWPNVADIAPETLYRSSDEAEHAGRFGRPRAFPVSENGSARRLRRKPAGGKVVAEGNPKGPWRAASGGRSGR